MKRTQTIVAALALVVPVALQAQATQKQTPTAAPASTPASAPASSAQLPAARQVIDRYIKAIGGREAMMKHQSRHVKSTLEIPAAGVRAEVESFQARPDKQLEKTNIPGMGEVMEGYDGTVAWSVNPVQGPRLLEGKELEQRRYTSDFNGSLHEGPSIKSIETVEMTDFDGKKAYKVKVTRPNGDESFEFFDVESRLLIGAISSQDSPMGKTTVTSVASEYKEFDGIRIPTKLTMRSSAGPEFIVTTTAVTFNQVDPKVFELPAQIKALTGK